MLAIHEAFTALLVAELNRMARHEHSVPDVDPEAHRRRREAMEGDVFEADDVTYVTPTPRVVDDGKAQFVMVIDDGRKYKLLSSFVERLLGSRGAQGITRAFTFLGPPDFGQSCHVCSWMADML